MSVQASPFSVEDTNRILGVMLSEIQSLRMTDAQQAVAAAGIIVTAQYWHPFRTQVNDAFQQMTVDDRLIALRILGGTCPATSESELCSRSTALSMWTAHSPQLQF
jgi:hypothetical protein